MLQFPNAKINIGLNITAKRPDGFHDIETVFYPIDFRDVLEFVPDNEAAHTELKTYGIKINADPKDNLVYKAYEILAEDFSVPALDVALYKNIPFGAGLGGGSSDAAFMLKMMNSEFSLKLSEERLKNYASKLGSDCAFFIQNRPVYAYGRGDKFIAIDLDLSAYYLMLIVPDFKISTPSAYSQIRPERSSYELRKSLGSPIEDWKALVSNDFEKVIFDKYPQAIHIKQCLYDAGAVYAALSGSGSAFYGIFRNAPQSEHFKQFAFSKLIKL
jgi:4-diphosphocytidyl-2-C-methyl-D-erythritol kinase